MWVRTTKADPDAVALANRHYSRTLYGKVGKMVGPPGRLLTFITPDKDAVWVSHWPYADLALDRLDAWRCTLFRNEGPALSSLLILEAMALTRKLWEYEGLPEDGWITWVNREAVQSSNPGYCFLKAGWVRDRTWVSTRPKTDPGHALIRLRASL